MRNFIQNAQRVDSPIKISGMSGFATLTFKKQQRNQHPTLTKTLIIVNIGCSL